MSKVLSRKGSSRPSAPTSSAPSDRPGKADGMFRIVSLGRRREYAQISGDPPTSRMRVVSVIANVRSKSRSRSERKCRKSLSSKTEASLTRFAYSSQHKPTGLRHEDSPGAGPRFHSWNRRAIAALKASGEKRVRKASSAFIRPAITSGLPRFIPR